MGELALTLAEEGWSQWKPRLTNPVTIQDPIQGSELAYPNIYSTYDLLEHVKGLVMQNHSLRISMTQGSSRTSERSFREGPVLMAKQKPETLNLPTTPCNERL